VVREIREWLDYDLMEGLLPTVGVGELRGLTYLSRLADRCVWEGRECVFKRIEFDCDVEVVGEEIRARETLIAAMALGMGADVEGEMLRRFRVVPILAVVIGDRSPWKPRTVAGVVMPFCGPDLEILARETDANLPITEEQLRDLVGGVRELARCGVEHGDIKYWNTVLEPREGRCKARLVLIDVGSVAPEYDGDAGALGTLLLWCLGHSTQLRETRGAKARVIAAAAALRAGNDFDAAMKVLALDRRPSHGSQPKKNTAAADNNVVQPT